ncbi:MAG: DoxX family protein [Bacteroidetes bacterium]|nr:DoxX family protein [Bacteroidota bacterium]MBS1932079.1 DoxX family protein [Bacteroidota bacterium]
MKKNNIIYWIATIIAAGLMAFASIPDILLTKDAVSFMRDFMHFPNYFTQFIGVAKMLGVIAILIPGFPGIKEWAYAGLIFDLVGAIYSQIALDVPFWGPQGGWVLMLIWVIPVVVSYFYYHKKLKASLLNVH